MMSDKPSQNDDLLNQLIQQIIIKDEQPDPLPPLPGESDGSDDVLGGLLPSSLPNLNP